MLLPTLRGAAPAQWWVARGEFSDVYANVGKRGTLETAVWLEQFRRTVEIVWRIDPKRIQRATVVRFRSEREFDPYRSSALCGGYFVRSEFMALIGFGTDHSARQAQKIVQHECTHWLMETKRVNLPMWTHVEPAPEVEVRSAQALLLLAGRRDSLGAKVALTQARDREPNHPMPYEGLATVALAEGEPHVAVQLFSQAVARGSRNPFARYFLAANELRDQLGGNPRRYSLLPEDARRLSDGRGWGWRAIRC